MALGMTNSGGLTAYNTTQILEKVTQIQEAISSGSISGGGSGSGTGGGGASSVTNATIDAGSSVEFKLGGDNLGVYVATGEDMAGASSYGIGMDSLGFYVNTEG